MVAKAENDQLITSTSRNFLNLILQQHITLGHLNKILRKIWFCAERKGDDITPFDGTPLSTYWYDKGVGDKGSELKDVFEISAVLIGVAVSLVCLEVEKAVFFVGAQRNHSQPALTLRIGHRTFEIFAK